MNSPTPPAIATHDRTHRAPAGATVRARLTTLILGPDPERQMNLKITLSAQPAYLATLILMWHCANSGLMDPAFVMPLALSLVGSMVLMYSVIRFGWTRRLRDPAMTVPQMMNALVFLALGSLASPPMHAALLSSVAVTMAYSVFALKGRQVVVVRTFCLALYGLGSAVMCYLQPQFFKPEVEILLMGVLATTVVMLTWSGSQIAELRARQRRQREELAQMLVRIEELATHDVLTGLHSRRHINTLLAHHIERTQRYGPPADAGHALPGSLQAGQ